MTLARRLDSAAGRLAVLPRPDLLGVRAALAELNPPPDAALDAAAWLRYELRVRAVLTRRCLEHSGRPDYVLDLDFEHAFTRLQAETRRLVLLAVQAQTREPEPAEIDRILAGLAG